MYNPTVKSQQRKTTLFAFKDHNVSLTCLKSQGITNIESIEEYFSFPDLYTYTCIRIHTCKAQNQYCKMKSPHILVPWHNG